MKNKQTIGCCALFIAVHFLTVAHASMCDADRAYAGAEGIASLTGNSLWQNGDAFRNNFTSNLYGSANVVCNVTDKVSVKANGVAQHAAALYEPGLLEGEKSDTLAILNEAYVTFVPNEKIFIDVGKIKRGNGFLFSTNPLDLLHNTSGNLNTSTVRVNGANKYNFYKEGSVGIGATIYADKGTFEVAALPQFTTHNSLQNSAEQWSSLERTNATDRVYMSVTSSKLNDFNPTLSVLLSEPYNVLGVGTSGYLNDNLILSIESTLAQGQRWRHLNTDAAQAIHQFTRVDDPFYQDEKKLTFDIALGLRYTDAARIEYGIEYYGQSQGYSRNEWDTYFNTISFINGGYAQQLPPALASSLSADYLSYTKLFAAEVDNANRAGNLLGKHYTTLFINSKKNSLHEWDWTGSVTTNWVDHSSLFNLNFIAYATNNIEFYTGSSISFGPKKRSEFGQFGNNGYFYAGIRFIM